MAGGAPKVLRNYRVWCPPMEIRMAAVEGWRVRTDENLWAQADGLDL